MPKQPKDPHAPKTPYSSYLIFSIERRPKLKIERPEVKSSELTKLIGVEWQALDEVTKQSYKTRADTARKEYVLLMTEYKKTDNFRAHSEKVKQWKESQKETAVSGNAPTSPNAKKSSLKLPKDVNRPKKPATSYFIFAASVRAQILAEQPKLSTTDIAKVIGPKWKALTETERQPFVEQAKQLKSAYTIAFEAYKLTPQFEEYQLKVKNFKLMNDPAMPKVKLPRKPKDIKCPKKSATSYFLFAREVRAEITQQNPGKSTTDIAKLIGARWKNVSEEEKAKLSKRAAELKLEYEVAIAKYRGSEDEKTYTLLVAEWETECDRKRMKAVEKMQEQKVKQALANKEKKKKMSQKKKMRVGRDDESSSDSSSDSDSSSCSTSSFSSSSSTSSFSSSDSSN